ncbi:MAG: hypothetical protein R3B48_29280 [Kofleriaceae bacterium]
MSAAAGREPTNVPCRRCGAPMRAQSDRHLDAAVAMVCEHCGAAEELPAEEARRVLALRALRMERQWAEDAASGPALTYLRTMERAGPLLLPYAFGVVLVAATALRGGLTSAIGLPLGVVVGAGLASFLALRVSRRRLRAVLGPLLRAAPGLPGRAQRCRRCGGELPASAAALVECPFCQAPNLVSGAVAAQLASELEAQTRSARAHAAAAAPHLDAAARFVRRAFQLAFLAGAALGAGAARLVFGPLGM